MNAIKKRCCKLWSFALIFIMMILSLSILLVSGCTNHVEERKDMSAEYHFAIKKTNYNEACHINRLAQEKASFSSLKFISPETNHNNEYSTDTFGSSMPNATGWKAGVAKVNITPEQPMWMAGYAARDHEAEGMLHHLWAKALALEDANGKHAVLITTDLLGIPKKMSDRIRQRLNDKYKLSKAQVLLNSSHTHSAPVLQDALSDIYPLNADQLKKVEQYADQLEDQVVDLVGEALAGLEPVRMYSENGAARFQVNRRNNDELQLNKQTELQGPNDYAVPVIKVVNARGDLRAIVFGYACHATVLSEYEWSGDYPGFAQLELEKLYPGATALFFQGAGADQNPLPRRKVSLAQQYGKTLAAAVEQVLAEDMRELAPQLTTAYSEVELAISDPPSKSELSEIVKKKSGYEQRWAIRLLDKIEEGESLLTTYPYPLQVWKLGDQPVFSLGGELVVAYAINLKKIFGPGIFVLGYSNDVMAYIPSLTILKEGGYEGVTSQIVYGLPGTWSASIETTIMDGIVKLAAQAGIPKNESKLIEN